MGTVKFMAGDVKNHVVVLAGSFGGLGVVRDLGKRGIRSTVMGRASYVGRSRYCSFIKTGSIEDMYRRLLELPADHTEKLVLFTDNDEYLDMIYSHWGELSRHYVIPTNPRNTVLTDKAQLYGAARKAGIPVPETYIGDEQWNVRRFPVITKPIERDRLWEQQLLHRKKAYECGSQSELEAVLRMMNSVHVSSITQEIIPGSLEGIHCVTIYRSPQGHVIVGDVLQKLGQYPTDYGTGTALVTAPNNMKLVNYTIRLLNSVNFIGVADVEYKYNAPRDDYYLIEVNARFPSFAGIMCKIGNQFAIRIYKDLVASSGYAVELSRVEPPANELYQAPQKPVVWLYLLNDIRWNTRRSVRNIFKSFRYLWKYRVQHATWDWRDPIPCFQYYLQVIRRLVTKKNKVVAHVQQPSLNDA